MLDVQDTSELPILPIFIRNLLVHESNNFVVGEEVIVGTVAIGWVIFVKFIVLLIFFPFFILEITRLGFLLVTGLVVNDMVL